MELGVKGEPFRCEWEGCQSRLHNLNMLERHVVIVHCRGKRRECLWTRCAYIGITFDTDEDSRGKGGGDAELAHEVIKVLGRASTDAWLDTGR